MSLVGTRLKSPAIMKLTSLSNKDRTKCIFSIICSMVSSFCFERGLMYIEARHILFIFPEKDWFGFG